MDLGTRMYSQSILYFVLLTLEVPISKSEITVSNGTVKFTVEPHPPVKLSAIPSAVTDIRQFMTSINEAPIPEGWQEMITADGRTYFRNVPEGKNTIAFDFLVPLEDGLVIPTVKP